MKLKRLSILALALVLVFAVFPAAASGTMTLKTTASVNLRTGPDTSYQKITAAASGKTFTYLGISNYDAKGRLWHKISYDMSSAWLYAGYTKVTVDGTVLSNSAFVTSTASVNLRRGAGTGYTVLATVQSGTKLFYLGASTKDKNGRVWYRVSSSVGPAWVSSRYAKLSGEAVESSQVVTTGTVWMRTGAGLGYAKITVIPESTTVTYLGKTSTDVRGIKWYKVKYDGKTGWVSSKYSKIK